MLPIVPIVWLSKFLYWLVIYHPKRMAEQRERDRLAQAIVEETERCIIFDILSGKDIPPFALYLRPFALEQNTLVNQLLSHELANF